jgi:hypothetical protein
MNDVALTRISGRTARRPDRHIGDRDGVARWSKYKSADRGKDIGGFDQQGGDFYRSGRHCADLGFEFAARRYRQIEGIRSGRSR